MAVYLQVRIVDDQMHPSVPTVRCSGRQPVLGRSLQPAALGCLLPGDNLVPRRLGLVHHDRPQRIEGTSCRCSPSLALLQTHRVESRRPTPLRLASSWLSSVTSSLFSCDVSSASARRIGSRNLASTYDSLPNSWRYSSQYSASHVSSSAGLMLLFLPVLLGCDDRSDEVDQHR